MKRSDRMRTRAFQAAPQPEPAPAPVETKPEVMTPKPKLDPAQEAIAQITTATKGMDWARVAGYAQNALTKGHLTEGSVEQAIDAALPDPQRAAQLPLHRLLAVASAASPARRPDYLAVIKQYPGMDQLPPDAKAQITDHLRMIGL